MIIKILGTGAETTKPPKPYLGKYKPSCLIISPPVTILIDVGKDILEKATKEELLDVTHILLIHGHSDSIDGIPTFNKFLEENNKTVELYALPQVFERIKLRWSEKSYSNYLFVPISTKKPFKIVDHTIKAVKVFHDPRFPTVAYNFDNVFIYASDMGPCITNPHTLVLTEHGFKPICKIKVGDKVYTHKGRLRKVTRTFKVRAIDQEEIIIRVRKDKNGPVRPLQVTPDHPIYVKRDGRWIWLPAKYLKEGDIICYLGHSCPKCGSVIPLYKKICSSCQGHDSEWWRQHPESLKRLKEKHKELAQDPKYREWLKENSKKGAAAFKKRFEEDENLQRKYRTYFKEIWTPQKRAERSAEMKRIAQYWLSKDPLHFHKLAVKANQCIKNRNVQPGLDAMHRNFKGKYTRIEQLTERHLKRLGVRYIKQYKIPKDKYCYYADFYLPDYNTIIECDGKHWHSKPEQIQKDKIRDEFLMSKGYNVIHLTEDEINNYDFSKLSFIKPSFINSPPKFCEVKVKQIEKRIRKSVYRYNLEVEEDNSYIASNIVVHNCFDEYELKYFSNNILAVLDGAYWDHQIPLNNHVAVLEHLDFILSLNNKHTLFTGMGNQWPPFDKANKILKEKLEEYKKKHPDCKVVELRTAKEGEKLMIDLNKLYSQKNELLLKPSFDTILNNPDILRRIPKKELLMVHLRCHQLWAIKRSNKVLQVHVLVVKEMFRRGLKHHVINDLDRKTYRILGREIKVYEIWEELQDEIVIKSNVVKFVGSSLRKSDPNDLDIIAPEAIYKVIKQFLKKYNPHYIGNDVSHGDVLNVYDLILKKKDSPNIVNPRLPDYTKTYKTCQIISKLPFKADTYIVEPLIKGKHEIVVDRKNRIIYEHITTDNNKEIITDLLAYKSDNLFKEILINRLVFMHKKWLDKLDKPVYLPIRWIVKKERLWKFLSSIKNKYDAVIIRPATFRYYDGKFILHFKKEKFCCECLDCGYRMISDKHCRDMRCPRCNGEMRRCERPGVGKSIDILTQGIYIDDDLYNELIKYL